MYNHTNNIRNCCNVRNVPYNSTNYNSINNDERFFLAPFLAGGLAGTALGYGIANNNQINRPPILYGPFYPNQTPYMYNQSYPVQQYPINSTYTSSNNFYY